MTQSPRAQKTRAKILETANDLFYKQGYRATVVNQIIEEAGVSKPTFYSHFPSKEDLCLAYLKDRRNSNINEFSCAINDANTPYERFMAPVRMLRVAMVNSDYRGCAFFNILVEIADSENPISKQVRRFNDGFRLLMLKVSKDLVKSDPKYSHLDPQYVADAYYMTFNGAIMFSQEYREPWVLDLAIEQVSRLLTPPE